MSALSSKLDAVTVFREGALCRRLATVPASAGRQFRLGGLPLSIDAGSFRARVVQGNGRVVDVRAQFDVEFVDEADVPQEQRALETINAKLAALEIQRQRLGAEITELQALKPAFLEQKRGEAPRKAPVEAMIALGDFTELELSSRLTRRRALDQEIKDAQAEQALRQRRLSEASSAQRTERSKLWRAAVVTLAEAPSETLGLELEYRVPGARWVPAYALTLDRGLANGTLQMRASIAQDTGEDWSQIALSLSTASTSRRADMPELKALKIGRRQEAPARSGWREPPPGLDGLFEAFDQGQAALPASKSTLTGGSSGGFPDVLAQLQTVEKSRSENRPAPPPPMPKSAPPRPGAVGGVFAAPSTVMPPAAAAPMMKRSSGSFAPQGGRGGGGRERAVMRSEDRADDEVMAEMADMPMEEDAAFGADGGGGEPEPMSGLSDARSPAAQFGDYARLTMPPPEAGAMQRGRLSAASEWDFAFVAGLSVQIDIVMMLVSRAQSRASSVHSLALPALCNPVTSIKAFDYRYDCGARLEVPSTGKWVLVPVMKCAVGLTPEYVCVPSVEQKVYRTLQIANRSTHALLPGPVDVTSGDEFLMTTSLPAIPPGAEQSHRLGLGVEEAIKVARKTQYKETTGGFLGGSSVLPHDIEIELNNRLAAPAMIEVRERIPVADPNEKDLKVEEVQVSPAWEKVETPIDDQILKGARRWRVTVPPGQSLKLTAQYAIRMPADRMLVGGNRRN